MMQRVVSWIKQHPFWSAAIAIVLAGLVYTIVTPDKPTYAYVSDTVSRGDVVSKVTASGKLRALNTIKVGAEVSGQILRVNVDFNTPVRAGQVLAEIDPTRFRARVQQGQAQVAVARAALAQAEAAVVRTRSDVEIQERDFARRAELSREGFLSKAGLDTSTGQVANARAALKTAIAQVASARAQISQSSAELTSAELDLRRTVIVAPVTGVVINKLVEPGTTVAASFQTPNLFEIAADTTRMQVEASVDEADIGQVTDGQDVRFSVDAYPEDRFPAVVRQIRKAATENQNVVSYLVILEVDNSDGRLLPGMTANVEIITGLKANVSRVPTQALRFRPREADRPASERKLDTDEKDDEDKRRAAELKVYVASADPYKPAARKVQVGLVGEDFAEVISGLKPGEKVLTRSRSLEKKKRDESADDEGNEDTAS